MAHLFGNINPMRCRFWFHFYSSGICDTCKHLLGNINLVRCRTRINWQRIFTSSFRNFIHFLNSLNNSKQNCISPNYVSMFRSLKRDIQHFEFHFQYKWVMQSFREESQSFGISDAKPRRFFIRIFLNIVESIYWQQC